LRFRWSPPRAPPTSCHRSRCLRPTRRDRSRRSLAGPRDRLEGRWPDRYVVICVADSCDACMIEAYQSATDTAEAPAQPPRPLGLIVRTDGRCATSSTTGDRPLTSGFASEPGDRSRTRGILITRSIRARRTTPRAPSSERESAWLLMARQERFRTSGGT